MSESDRDAYHSLDLSQSIDRRVKAMFYSLTKDPDYEGWDTAPFREITPTSITEGKCEFEFVVNKAMCNKRDTLHGGCAATILDNLTSTTFLTIAKPGYLDAGSVSRTLSCTYLRPVAIGTKVRVVCEAVAAGKTLAHCRGDIITMNGKVCVTCVHDKGVLSKSKL